MSEISKRIMDYRKNVRKIKTQKEMAKILNISERYYSMVERGDKNPSKTVLDALVKDSGLTEPYWKYGLNIKEEENQLGLTQTIMKELINRGDIKKDAEIDDNIMKLLINAIKIDIKAMIEDREIKSDKI